MESPTAGRSSPCVPAPRPPQIHVNTRSVVTEHRGEPPTPDTTEPLGPDRPPRAFRPDIQGLRGLAVALVVLYHAHVAFPGGFVGVDVFFVISGFLIGGQLFDQIERTGRISLVEFLARRARRLMPALALATSITVALSVLVVEIGRPLRATAKTGIAASFAGANVQLHMAESDYFAPSAERNPLLHTWSLSVEEQFYLALPLLFIAAGVLARRGRASRLRGGLLTVLAVGAVSSVVLSEFLVRRTDTFFGMARTESLAFYAPFTRAWEFTLGVVLAIAWTARARASTPGVGVRGAGVLGLGLILWSALALNPDVPFPGVNAAAPAIGTALVLMGGSDRKGWPHRLLSTPVLTRLGDLSYSLYLWHWPAIVLATALWPTRQAPWIAAAASLIPGWLSYRFVEQRFRVTGRAVGRRTLALVGIAILVPGLTSYAALRANSALTGRASAAQVSLAESSGCLVDRDETTAWPRSSCLVDGTSDDLTVLLIGDSHAASLSDGLLLALEPMGASLAMWTRGGTPFIDTAHDAPGSASIEDASRAFLQTLELVERLDPAIVVIANRSPRAIDPSRWHRWSSATFESEADAVEEWGRRVRATMAHPALADRQVLWVAVVPEFLPDLTRDGTPRRGPSLLRPRGVSGEMGLDQLDRRRGAVLAVESRAAADFAHVTLFDPAPTFCASTCRSSTGHVVAYRDDHHLAPAGSLLLAPALNEVIAALPRAPDASSS